MLVCERRFQEFLIVQQILEGNNFGYKQDKTNQNRPLIHMAE